MSVLVVLVLEKCLTVSAAAAAETARWRDELATMASVSLRASRRISCHSLLALTSVCSCANDQRHTLAFVRRDGHRTVIRYGRLLLQS